MLLVVSLLSPSLWDTHRTKPFRKITISENTISENGISENERETRSRVHHRDVRSNSQHRTTNQQLGTTITGLLGTTKDVGTFNKSAYVDVNEIFENRAYVRRRRPFAVVDPSATVDLLNTNTGRHLSNTNTHRTSQVNREQKDKPHKHSPTGYCHERPTTISVPLRIW